MSQQQPLPAYYDILHVSPTATTEEIRNAYKKESLRTHPDRQPNASPAQKKVLTEKFQALADAYYVLSDPQRRREYDILLRSRGTGTAGTGTGTAGAGAFPFSTDPSASAAFFEQFKSFFAKPSPSPSSSSSTAAAAEEEKPEGNNERWGGGARPDADGVFGDVFEELLRPEVQRHVSWWSYLGTVSGASLGFILANVPGALAGGLAGNRLGAIRDAKGKPVIKVFSELGGSQKAEILKALALKVFGSLGSI